MRNRLLLLPLKIAIEVRYSHIGAFWEFGAEMVNHHGCKYRLAGSGYTWTEERLTTGLQPIFILPRVQKPFASARLVPF